MKRVTDDDSMAIKINHNTNSLCVTNHFNSVCSQCWKALKKFLDHVDNMIL